MSDDNPKPPNPEATPQGGDAQPRGDAPAEPKATPQVEPQPRGHPPGDAEAPARGKGKGKGKDTPEGKARGKGKKGPEGQPRAPEPEGPPPEPAPRPRLLDHYEQRVRQKLQQQFGFKNPHEIPRLVKIVLNVGMGDAPKNPKGLDAAVAELAAITGQHPVVTRAKKAIANFNLREGVPIGCAVTLRGARMYEFLDRFITIAVPRMRDFRGLPSKSFDGRGNYTVGIKEQMIFPEIDYDKVEKIHGMDITIVTTAGRDDAALALLREMGMPFRGEAPVAA
ncbi:MAG: 50S ribosomal protein L5 [Gemmatimonadetes bacterium]|nr:MAG: 50S ribosomal protein L5 [Gemmatimonadota bacterium]